jgi:hypothetical protein
MAADIDRLAAKLARKIVKGKLTPEQAARQIGAAIQADIDARTIEITKALAPLQISIGKLAGQQGMIFKSAAANPPNAEALAAQLVSETELILRMVAQAHE